MMRISMMNLVLHGIRRAHVKRANALSELGGLSDDDLNRKYKVILSNPPFAGMLPTDSIRKDLPTQSKKSELLFLGLAMEALAPGGRCAVILPEGALFGSTSAHIELRRKLVHDFDLLAVISLPAGVFKPYAGVKTGILIFRKPVEASPSPGGEGRGEGETSSSSSSSSFSSSSNSPSAHRDANSGDATQRRPTATTTGYDSPSPGGEGRSAAPKSDVGGGEGGTKKSQASSLAPRHSSPSVFFYEIKNDGFDPDKIVGGGRPETPEKNELPELLRQWKAYKDSGFKKPPGVQTGSLLPPGTPEPKCWYAPASLIAENDFNLAAGRYKPQDTEKPPEEDPADLITKTLQLERDITTGLEKLLADINSTT